MLKLVYCPILSLLALITASMGRYGAPNVKILFTNFFPYILCHLSNVAKVVLFFINNLLKYLCDL